MIKSLKDISLRFLKSNKSITIACISAIALSIFLITSLMNFSLNSENKLKQDMLEKFGAFELQFGYENDAHKNITNSFMDNVNSIEGIEKTSPALVTGDLQIQGITVYTLGLEDDNLSRSKYNYSKNLDDNQVFINENLAENLKVSVGDKIDINGYKKTVGEVFKDKTDSSTINMLIMNRKSLKEILKLDYEATFIMVKVSKDASAVAEKLKSIDDNLRIQVFEQDEFVQKNVTSLKYFVAVLGVLVITMCGILIISNLQEYIYKYTKEFAIIKAIGGSSQQVSSILKIQTLLINIIGVILGLVLTCISSKIFLPSFNVYYIPLCITALVGFIIMQFILHIPAARTAKILPVQAMDSNEKIVNEYSKGKKTVSLILIGIGVFIEVYAILLKISDGVPKVLLGYLFILIGIFMFIRVNMTKILTSLIKPFGLVFGTIGSMSIKTSISQIKKSYIVIIAIATSMIITSVGSNFTKAIMNNTEDYYRKEYRTDIVIISGKNLKSDEFMKLFNDVSSLDKVKVSMIAYGGTTRISNRSNEENINYSLGSLKEMTEQGLIKEFKGDEKSKVVVSESYAKEKNIKIGQEIRLANPEFGNNSERQIEKYDFKLEVIDIVDDSLVNYKKLMIDFSNKVLIDKDTSTFYKININTESPNIQEALQEIKANYPSIKWATLQQVLEENNRAFNERWGYFQIALSLIILFTILGVVNSIKNNMNTRRKEYAVLRCMKFTSKDLRKMLIIQFIVFLGIGELIGCILGYVGSFVLICSDGIRFFVPDYKMLLINIGGTLIVSVIYLVPYVMNISKKKINMELSMDES
ncbi:ABC transporter permease [Clostridium sp. SHJSY1]|uniref:FtsX-like permease family protein n=1 Tax=Clostridium sp. SHJSY1 TaxID=2942483 RepID=UPI002876D6FD|nr:FtsX-like permease family protein [Clostridium sp. SHJSY1]MDS0525769.1 ABC transporter permease [Clostridium sp. SHJSY1]